MTEESTIRLGRDESGVVTVTLNRPSKKNALAPHDSGLLLAIVESITRSMTDRVVVLTGAGDAFCAGADLSAGTDRAGQPNAGDGLARIQDVALALARLPQPLIAAVNGAAVGAGLGLALAADIVLCSDTARFSAIFVKRALSVDTGISYILPRLVGLSRARELALTGRMVDAVEAHRIGLVTDVVAADDLMDVATRQARDLAGSSATALRLIKQTMAAGSQVGLEEALSLETAAQKECARSPEFAAARTAFAMGRAHAGAGLRTANRSNRLSE